MIEKIGICEDSIFLGKENTIEKSINFINTTVNIFNGVDKECELFVKDKYIDNAVKFNIQGKYFITVSENFMLPIEDPDTDELLLVKAINVKDGSLTYPCRALNQNNKLTHKMRFRICSKTLLQNQHMIEISSLSNFVINSIFLANYKQLNLG